jgi:hypothetical protein
MLTLKRLGLFSRTKWGEQASQEAIGLQHPFDSTTKQLSKCTASVAGGTFFASVNDENLGNP